MAGSSSLISVYSLLTLNNYQILFIMTFLDSPGFSVQLTKIFSTDNFLLYSNATTHQVYGTASVFHDSSGDKRR